MPQRALHVLELPAPFKVIALRQRHLGEDALLQFGDKPAKVATGNIDADDDAPLTHVATDLGRAVDDADVRQRFERHLRAVWRGKRQAADFLDRVTKALGQANCGIEAALPLVNLRRHAAANRRLYDIVHVADVESLAGNGLPVYVYGQILLAGDALDANIARTRHRTGDAGDLVGGLAQRIEVIAEYLYRNVGPHTGNHFVDPVGNRLRHRQLYARQRAQLFLDGRGNGVLRPALGPLRARLQ